LRKRNAKLRKLSLHDAKLVNENVNKLWRQHASSNNEKKRLRLVDKRVRLKRQRRKLVTNGNQSLLLLLLLLRRRSPHGGDHEPMDNSLFLQHAPRAQRHRLLSIRLPLQEEGDGERDWRPSRLLLLVVVVEMQQLLLLRFLLPQLRLLSR
jgi:hypothetical protein